MTEPATSNCKLNTTNASVHVNCTLQLLRNISVPLDEYYNGSPHENQLGLEITVVLICVLGVLATMANMVVLLASKFTSGGQTPTLVFIRSLCVSDTLVGIFGVLRAIQLFFLEYTKINCFLPESVLVAASTASSLSLLWLNIDCYLKLSRPLDYTFHMHKKNVIAVMVILWNFSFIIGFLPQMGWSIKAYSCEFFDYYDSRYLLFVATLWILSITLTISIQIYLCRLLQHIRTNHTIITPHSKEYKKYVKLIITTRIDVCTWLLGYMPVFVYTVIFCKICVWPKQKDTNLNILYFIPPLLLKAVISALVHGYKTAQIHEVITQLSRQVTRKICRSIQEGSGGKRYNISNIFDERESMEGKCSSHMTVCTSLSNEQIDILSSDEAQKPHNNDRNCLLHITENPKQLNAIMVSEMKKLNCENEITRL